MTGIAQQIDATVYGVRQDNARYAPFNRGIDESMESAHTKSRIGALAVLVTLLLLSGITVAVGKGYADAVETYVGSPEGLLSLAWVVQGAIALLCFVLAVRWLRS
jgi:hypothetical protein